MSDAKPPHRIYRMTFASVYPHYLAKVERKGRTKAELDEVVRWLTGYDAKGLKKAIADARDFETFFAKAPRMNPARSLVTGVVCGVRVETVEGPLMREARILDKLVDELAKGWAMEKVKRAAGEKEGVMKPRSHAARRARDRELAGFYPQ